MSSRPLVSVVTIFLNEERFLGEAIASVLGQTLEDWELLLVDDGSCDRSTEIAKAHAAQDPRRIRYLEHPGHANRGMSAARNLGLRAAKGEMIAFLDADDVWLPGKLEEQGAILRTQEKAAMVYGRPEYWFSWTDLDEDRDRDYIQEHWIESEVLVEPPGLFKSFLQGKAALPGTTSTLLRKQAVADVGFFEESFTDLYEDQVFFAKVCLEWPVFVASGCWDRYRQHSASSCSLGEQDQREARARETYLTWLYAYVREHRPDDPRLASMVNTELWFSRNPAAARFRRRFRRLAKTVKGSFG